MKRKIVLFVVLGIGTVGFGAGTLTPQGAPAPTMKTLDEIDQSVSNTTAAVKIAEPRTPLIEGASGVIIDGNGTIYINQSGSYYLTTNLTVSFGNGIVVSTNGVTVDLNGFTIRSTAATPGYSGIEIGASHVSIFNGHIESRVVYDSSANDDQFTGSGFQHGIRAPLSSYSSVRIRNISVSGCDLNGIYILTQDSLVESCTVRVVGNYGIMAGVVKNCSAITCGGVAISGTQIIDCRGSSTADTGIYSGGTVANSYGYTSSTSSSAIGIRAVRSVQNSYGYSTGGNGIYSSGVVASCYGYSMARSGIYSNGTVINSYGYANGTSTDVDGIYAFKVVQNSSGVSMGRSGIYSNGTVANSSGETYGTSISVGGIYATKTVQNSYGYSAKGDGIRSKIVSYSYGRSDGTASSADGIESTIAIGCVVSGGENITHKYLMP